MTRVISFIAGHTFCCTGARKRQACKPTEDKKGREEGRVREGEEAAREI